MENISQLIIIIVAFLSGLFINYLSSYMKEKGKNVATKEDIKEITDQIESVKSEYAASSEFLKTNLAILQDKHLSVLRDKIDIYRAAIIPMINLFVPIIVTKKINADITDKVIEFEQNRLKIHVQLALFAPQSVLDTYDSMIDYLLNLIEGKQAFDWPKIRTLAFNFINEIRKDIGLNIDPVTYRGER